MLRKENINPNEDDKYYEQLNKFGYKVYYPKEGSKENIVVSKPQKIAEIFTGPDVLNINIRVKVYLIDKAEINAAVCKIENIYYISIFRGAITEVKDFVQNFVMRYFPYSFFKTNFGILYEDSTNILEFFTEDDCEHYNLANNIANNILFMIFYHEMGHILAGHQEIYFNNKDIFWLEKDPEKDGNIDSQAKELMADIFSLINSLGVYNYSHHRSMKEYRFYQCSYLISLYSLYIYFEGSSFNNGGTSVGSYEELVQRSHPHPAIRLLYMLDFLSDEISFELKNLFKVDWLTNDNASDILQMTEVLAYSAICEFSLELPLEYRLINKVYDKKCLQIRQLVQNIASDLYKERYQKVNLVEFQGIGKVSDKYVNDLLQANEELGKYDA